MFQKLLGIKKIKKEYLEINEVGKLTPFIVEDLNPELTFIYEKKGEVKLKDFIKNKIKRYLKPKNSWEIIGRGSSIASLCSVIYTIISIFR